MKTEYKADFLWGFTDGSIDEAGYEFANAQTEEYQKLWWGILVKRIQLDALDKELERQRRS